jgi:hypothetical protein
MPNKRIRSLKNQWKHYRKIIDVRLINHSKKIFVFGKSISSVLFSRPYYEKKAEVYKELDVRNEVIRNLFKKKYFISFKNVKSLVLKIVLMKRKVNIKNHYEISRKLVMKFMHNEIKEKEDVNSVNEQLVSEKNKQLTQNSYVLFNRIDFLRSFSSSGSITTFTNHNQSI